MSHTRSPASDLLPVMAAAFPYTFFADPKRVKPLKINIHRDLNNLRQAHALPVEISLIPLRRFRFSVPLLLGPPVPAQWRNVCLIV